MFSILLSKLSSNNIPIPFQIDLKFIGIFLIRSSVTIVNKIVLLTEFGCYGNQKKNIFLSNTAITKILKIMPLEISLPKAMIFGM